MRQWIVRLDRAALSEVRDLLARLGEIVASRSEATDGRPYSLTTALARLDEPGA